jgi:hypothetical protein
VADVRREKSARLRRVLARYRGGRFEVSGSGGAGGMMFFRDPKGAQYYIGGFNPADAEQIATGLNLVLELLEERPISCNIPRNGRTDDDASG